MASPDLNARPTTLYRAFNESEQLLYIGIAANWPRRWEQHSERSPWFAQVARIETKQYPNRRSAMDAEREAIQAEHPIHNIEHTPRDTRPMRQGANKSMTANTFRPDSLVGSFFHSGAEPGWQGHVVGEPAQGTYLVETFSWIMGETAGRHLVSLQRMMDEGWTFYDSSDSMKYAYEYGGVRERWARDRGEWPNPGGKALPGDVAIFGEAS